ncbi:hypothetical protein [Neobacillus sp. PS2-9]|uniref:hypothetical protein n=1 Tax=Neobacillus sp. PS2-9 TaxID=3070676 RepID=UPI0027E0A14D|nr:hypothetical protein [Neobacillus sp. PS2-9]WML58629.1 hypothetical protein RCG25_02210 [Neobacillus sp. PS2-9]
MQPNLKISNIFTFKTSLEIALEVTFPVLPSEVNENLNSLLKRIPNKSGADTITASNEEKKQLKDCINAFKHTKSCIWLREDFLQALNDISQQC